jgi:hypothetical protein
MEGLIRIILIINSLFFMFFIDFYKLSILIFEIFDFSV